MNVFFRRSWMPVLLVACAATPAAQPSGSAKAPGAVQSTVAALVAATMTTRHYDRHVIDDAVSAEWFDSYLKMLDRDRLYFVQADIDEFMPFRDKLDDDIQSRTPKLEAAYLIRQRWVQRLTERVDHISKLLDQNKFDFSDPKASIQIDREKASWPKDTAEQDELWRLRVSEQILRMELGGDERKIAIERIRKRYHRLLTEEQDLDADDVLEPYLAALTLLYDPHSEWMKPISKENFDIDMADTLIGIGAVLQAAEGYVTISELVPGGPAAMSGELAPADRILAVAQEGQDPVDVVDMRLDKVVKLIRGAEKTKVILTVWPGDAKDPSERKLVTITRDRVKLARAAATGAVTEVEGLRIGVIDVPSFYEDDEGRRAGLADWGSTARDTAKLLAQWQAEGPLDAVVIDLRLDGGGALDQAIELTGLFIDKGPVVQIRDGDGRIESLDDEVPGVAYAGPMVVLTSEQSASASEIFAGAIQDWGRGLIVGSETTHGKGSVQNLQSLDRMLPGRSLFNGQDPGSLKYTTHMFFRVEGASTQIQGVHADVVLPSPYQGLKIKESDLDHALPWDRVPPAAYTKQPINVDVDALRTASAWRVKSGVEFSFLQTDLAERARLEAETTLSLNEAQRQADIDRAKRIDEARTNARAALGEDPKHLPDPIMDEATSVARDYVLLLRGKPTLITTVNANQPKPVEIKANPSSKPDGGPPTMPPPGMEPMPAPPTPPKH